MNGIRSLATDLVIYGAGGMGQEIADLASSAGISILGFVDDRADLAGREISRLPVLGGRDWLVDKGVAVCMGIGSPAERRAIWEELRLLGIRESPALVHPTAYVGWGCEIGAGSVIAATATLTADVRIGRHAIVNAGATVSHNSRLADYVTVAPGAHLAGNTTVEEGADIGIGASVIQRLHVGEWSIVGAGAVVIRDVAPNATVVGCPARTIASRQPGWYL